VRHVACALKAVTHGRSGRRDYSTNVKLLLLPEALRILIAEVPVT
jgi:hypothetical protein